MQSKSIFGVVILNICDFQASHNDPDLQLALALSKSLYEKEMEEWDEAQIIAISSSSPLPDNNVENAYKTTLQNFGFTSNRNVLASTWPNKTKKSMY